MSVAEQKLSFQKGSEVNIFDRLCKICVPYKSKENEEAEKGSGARLCIYIQFQILRFFRILLFWLICLN